MSQNDASNNPELNQDEPMRNQRNEVYLAHANMMSLALGDAGRWCYGIKAIEVWLYDEQGKLKLADSGSWIDPLYFENDDPEIGSALRALYDPGNPEYKENESVSYVPGEGLPGILWSDTSRNASQTVSALNPSTLSETNRKSQIEWRDVQSLADDPDQPYNPRLMTIAKAGFRLAAGVPFKNRRTKGIVVYMARGSVRMERMKSNLNEEYILASTEHIGSVQALRRPRKYATIQRAREVRATFLKVKRILKVSGPMFDNKDVSSDAPDTLKGHKKESKSDPQFFEGKPLKPSTCEKIKQTSEKAIVEIKTVSAIWFKKMQGGNVKPPPSMSLDISIFVICAAFCTCLVMSCIDLYLRRSFGETLGFEYGQIASLTTMAYTLTASPAAQPRSILAGHIASMLVGMTVALIPDTSTFTMKPVRYAAAISISSGVMAKLGVAHPPGGSLANTFLSFRWGLTDSYRKMGIIVLQDVIFILLISAVNNVHSAKNYPTYWGHTPNMISKFVRSKLVKQDYDPHEKNSRRRSSSWM